MKAHWTFAVVGVAALVLAGGCQATGTAVEEVVIGADLELTGPAANIGKVYAQALALKVEQVNDEGALRGRKLTLVVRDNRSDAATSVANVNALAADRSVSALITGVCGQCALSAVKAVNAARVPAISLALPTAVATPVADRRYVFKLAPNLSDDATVLATEMTNANLKTVALVATEDDLGHDAVEAMTSKAEKAKLQVVSTTFVPSATDKLATAANDIAVAKPDAVVVLAFSPTSAQVGKALRDAQYQGRLFFGSASADSLFLTGATAPAMDGAGLVFTPTLVSDDIIATSPAKATRMAWFRDYLSKYGTYAAYASFAADAVQLIVQGINEVGTDRDTLRTAIEASNLDGLSGPIRLTPANHSGLMPQAVRMLVAANGRWRLAS